MCLLRLLCCSYGAPASLEAYYQQVGLQLTRWLKLPTCCVTCCVLPLETLHCRKARLLQPLQPAGGACGARRRAVQLCAAVERGGCSQECHHQGACAVGGCAHQEPQTPVRWPHPLPPDLRTLPLAPRSPAMCTVQRRQHSATPAATPSPPTSMRLAAGKFACSVAWGWVSRQVGRAGMEPWSLCACALPLK